MMAMWHSYYAQSWVVLFLVDLADPAQLPEASVQLLELLQRRSAGQPVMVAMNKSDAPCAISREEAGYILRLDDLPVDSCAISAADGTGIVPLVDWIQNALSKAKS